MFKKTEFNQFFPTCVWVHKVDDAEGLNRHLRSEVAELRAQRPPPAGADSGWQSAADLHTLEAFAPLVRYLLAASRGVFEFLSYDYERLEITNCWANINLRGHSNRDHIHPNNYLSGVYYVSVPEDSGRIVFRDPRAQAMIFVPAVKQRNPFNSDEHGIVPEEGDLILFHAWLAHMVEPNRSDRERISIAFNVTLKGRIGIELAGAVF